MKYYEDLEKIGMEWVSILISAVLSGLLGVFISNWYHNKNEIKREKIKVLQQLFGSRYDIKGENFIEALNQIFVMFYDSPEVLTALKEFHEVAMSGQRPTTTLANQKLLDLFKAMCMHLNIKIEPLTDNFFLIPFMVRQGS